MNRQKACGKRRCHRKLPFVMAGLVPAIHSAVAIRAIRREHKQDAGWMGICRHQSTKRYAVHWRDERYRAARVGTPCRRRGGLHEALRAHASCLCRVSRGYYTCDPAREEHEALATSVEASLISAANPSWDDLYERLV